MGVEQSSKRRVQRRSAAIDWTSRSNVDVGGSQKSDQFVDPLSLFCGQLFRQFDTMVPPIAQLCATWGGPTPADFWLSPRSASTPCGVVRAQIWHWTRPAIPELTMALARTSTSDLDLSLSNDHGDDSLQGVMNAGLLLTTLVCGRPMYAVSDRNSNSFPDTIRLEYGRVKCLSSWMRGSLFTAICSAVAEVSAEAHLACLEVFFKGSGQWSWLIYALCCGASNAFVPSVNIWQGRVTKSDITAISAVLQTKYPQPKLDSNGKGSHAYGFVDIRAGTELHPVLDDDNGSGFVLSGGCRCRAPYDPNDSVSWVNFVVPGYGICKAKLGEGVKFTPDSGKPVFPEKRLCGSLALYHVTFKTPAVLMEFLTLVASGLRSLAIDLVVAIRIDLCALSMAFPELQHLSVSGSDMVVSAHDKS